METKILRRLIHSKAVLWAGVLFFIFIFAVLNFGFFVEVFQAVGNRAFLSGFGTFLVITILVSVLGGSVGVALGKLIELNDRVSRSSIQCLRVGRWLPFFVFWALPIWRDTHTRNDLPIVTWLATITMGIIAGGPTVLLGACYYYLSYRNLSKIGNRRTLLQVARSVFLLALLVCLLFPLFFENGWPWQWYVDPAGAGAHSAAAFILLLTIVSLLSGISQESLYSDIHSPSSILANQFHLVDGRSRAGVILICVAGFLCWQLWSQTLQEALLIAPPTDVTRVTKELLVTGSNALGETQRLLWSDITVSLEEIAGGVLVAGTAAHLSVAILRERYPKILFFTAVAPITLTLQVLFWVGVGIWQKILTIALFLFYPMAVALWSYRRAGLPQRFLLAIEEGLPYAFIGMVFAEAWAGTAGLGFTVLVTGATGHLAEAMAASFITFGLLAITSAVLRITIKRILVSHT